MGVTPPTCLPRPAMRPDHGPRLDRSCGQTHVTLLYGVSHLYCTRRPDWLDWSVSSDRISSCQEDSERSSFIMGADIKGWITGRMSHIRTENLCPWEPSINLPSLLPGRNPDALAWLPGAMLVAASPLPRRQGTQTPHGTSLEVPGRLLLHDATSGRGWITPTETWTICGKERVEESAERLRYPYPGKAARQRRSPPGTGLGSIEDRAAPRIRLQDTSRESDDALSLQRTPAAQGRSPGIKTTMSESSYGLTDNILKRCIGSNARI